MSFKYWPSWAKGGIIGFLIGTIFILPYFLQYFHFISAFQDGFAIFFGKFRYFSVGISAYLSLKNLLLFFLIPILIYFLIGALIGFIVGKIKSKNMENKQ